ncbi:hypothetical protein E3N88_45422 [Mikania micrantha]|nr:hypothetical protein E3N88_45422 [Mikania micrantha]
MYQDCCYIAGESCRDVALRCRWMTNKRKKQDELKLGRKLKDKKDKLVEFSLKKNISSDSTLNVAPFSVTLGYRLEALSISMRDRLEQNNQILGQISTNISALKVSVLSLLCLVNMFLEASILFNNIKLQLQDNVKLFNHATNNITAILKDMRYIPGTPLPVSLNTNLVNTIQPTTSQVTDNSLSTT